VYNSSTIRIDGARFWVGTQRYRNTRSLRPLFANFKEAEVIYLKGLKQERTGSYINIGSSLLLLGAAIMVGNNDNKNRDGVVYGLLGGSLILSSVSFVITIGGRRKVEKAIWIYNRDMLLGERK
jgi:hypothetical protein